MDFNKEINIDYLAGFIDGEGCLGISKRKRRKPQHIPNYFPYLSITNTNLELITWLKKKLGGCVSIMKNKDNPNWKTSYGLYLDRGGTYKILKLIKDKLILKCRQANIMLFFMENRKNLLSVDRERLYLRMKKLNKRGL